jgi:hypothetical protein
METVQLTITDAPYASALRELLERGGTWQVRCVEAPDPEQAGVIVVDSDSLDRVPFPFVNPERVVLITRNDPPHLSQAWNAGIRSVVFNQDPLSTAVLAIMAAELRVPKSSCRAAAAHAGPSGAGLEAGSGSARAGGSAAGAPDSERQAAESDREGAR